MKVKDINIRKVITVCLTTTVSETGSNRTGIYMVTT